MARDYHPFDNYDPLTGRIPEDMPLAYAFEARSQQCRRFLDKHRDKQTLLEAVETIGWMLRQGKDLETRHLIETMKSEGVDSLPVSPAHGLWLRMEQFDIEGQKRFPKAQWHEYFAIMALSQIGHAVNAYVEPDAGTDEILTNVADWDAKQIANYRQQNIEHWLDDANEAAIYAQCLFDQHHQQKRAGAAGAKKRVAELEAFKEWVEAEWAARHTHRSNREAAKRLWDTAPDEFRRLLRTDDPAQRLAVWIGDIKKRREA